MAETVDAARRVWAVAVTRQEQHARCAERQEGISGADHANANRTRRIVAAARNDRNAGHAPSFGDFRAEFAGELAALEQLGHMGTVEPCCGQYLIRPVACGDIHPKRSCAV